jgi:hypothetical protein
VDDCTSPRTPPPHEACINSHPRPRCHDTKSGSQKKNQSIAEAKLSKNREPVRASAKSLGPRKQAREKFRTALASDGRPDPVRDRRHQEEPRARHVPQHLVVGRQRAPPHRLLRAARGGGRRAGGGQLASHRGRGVRPAGGSGHRVSLPSEMRAQLLPLKIGGGARPRLLHRSAFLTTGIAFVLL